MPTSQIRRQLLYFCTFVFTLLTLTILVTLRSQASRAEQTDDTLPVRTPSQQEQQAQQAREQRLRELDAKLKDPGMLLLRAAEFDPLKTTPTAVRIGASQLEMVAPAKVRIEAQATDAAYLIVQFADIIQPQQTESLRARGYEIKAYVPNNAYLVKAPRTQQTRLLANRANEFRWVGAYGAGLKVQPDLAKLSNDIANKAQVENADEIPLSFTTFSGEKAEPIKAALASLGLKNSANLVERFDGVTTGRIVVTPAELPKLIAALAHLEGIEWIERQPRARPENDNAVKLMQAGPTANDTPLYRNGLTGAGQIVGIADTGLDTDHAQFRLSSDAAAQTFSLATTTKALVNGELPFRVTNPNNKVLTYYVLGLGRLLDNANNPNGGKVLDPNEEDDIGYVNAVAYDDSYAYHGTHTTSVLAGRDYAANASGAVAGISTRTSGDGVAPDARIVFQDVGHPSGDYPGLSLSQVLIHQQSYNTGARIHTESFGFDGPEYSEFSAEVDHVMWHLRDYTIFFSAGNSGPFSNSITKDSKNALLVGGAGSPTGGNNPENLESRSSHGPAADGRIKPDIVTLFTVTAATELVGNASSYNYLTSTTANDAAVNPVSPNNNRSFSTLPGTSFSSPMAAGGGALVRQYFVDGYYPTGARNAANGFNPSNALIKAMVLNSGRNMTGNYTADNAPSSSQRASLPSMGQGWGRMTLDDALYFPGDRRELNVLADIWNGATAADATRPATNPAIMTGQTHTYQLTNVSTVEPLRISLVWTDPKATPSATTALINNLNLEVTDPTGKVFRGNVNFQNAFTQPAGTAAFDNKNPLEAVYIQYPNPGTYTVKVIGANVPGNGQMGIVAQPGNQLIDSNRQGYALLATGNFTAGAMPIATITGTSVSGGVNADRFVSRNETVTATVTVNNPISVVASNVNVQIAIAPTSQVPANLVRLNGLAAGQSATINLGDLVAATTIAQAFQVTLVNDASIQNGQTITFNLTITPANGTPFTTQFSLSVETAVYAAPLTNNSTTVGGAGFAGTEVAPGALVSSFGSGFLAGTSINSNAQSLPLPTTLNGVSVRVNGVLAPLLYVGVGAQFGAPGAFQINYQLPFETTPGMAFVEVLNSSTPVTSEFLTVRAAAPGIFSIAQNGSGQAAVLNQDNSTNNVARPEARGRVLQIYATGNGGQLLNSITRQSIALTTGAAAPLPASANDPLYVTAFTPTVTVGGVPAAVEFSGLAPGFVGLWQLNVRIPANAPTGNAVPLVVTVDGRASNQTTVVIN